MIRLSTLVLLAFTVPAAAQPSDKLAQRLTFSARFDAYAATAIPVKASATPRLKRAARIIGEIVHIGDLIENAGAAADVAIFRAPDLGETGSVSVARVVEAVTPHGVIDVDTGGLREVLVTRASRAITPADFERRVLRALARREHVADTRDLAINFDGELRTVEVEPDAGEPRIARIAFEPRGGRFDIIFELPGRSHRLLRLTGTCTETFKATVLARTIRSGSLIQASDVTLVRRPKTELRPDIVIDANQVIGLAARHRLQAGRLIHQNDLMKPLLVARNDIVTITYDVPGITLTLRGKALAAGARGDTINVLNETTKKKIEATVVGIGRVSVMGAASASPVLRSQFTADAAPRRIQPQAHVVRVE